MRYVSTRGAAPVLGFEDVLLAGLARDGGLYVPESWPRFSPDQWRRLQGLPYAPLAVEVMAPFVGDAIPRAAFAAMVEEAYAGFAHRAVTPLRQSGADEWVLELFHGPTLAFKDCALQLLGRLFDHVLAKRRQRITIVGATSGDTGSAAIEACRGRDSADIFILFPHGRVSEIQRRQMTTVGESNVHAIAIQGTFDDCQAMVKAMFDDAAFRDRHRLSAVNSINWARVMAQIVYFAHAALALGAPDRRVSFAVPTGNFGDIFAGYAAKQMGLPVARLCVATNTNDILARFLEHGAYETGSVVPTMSPSMDIQVSSNFERVLFDLAGRDGGAISAWMGSLKQSGSFRVTADQLAAVRAHFDAARIGEEETLATMAAEWRDTGVLVDPHSAVGMAAGRRCRGGARDPWVHLATAHPAKFPDAVERATGQRPALPPHLADLPRRTERYDVLANDLQAVQAYIASRARAA